MKAFELLKGCFIIEPNLIPDGRGYFQEVFKQSEFERIVPNVKFVQDNESKSSYGVVRGLHFQTGKSAQSKLVRVTKGSILDVVVDLRYGSRTYGDCVKVILTDENKSQLFVPKGFAHGFVVLSDEAVVSYKVDTEYDPNAQGGINPLDEELNIDWKVRAENMIISERDKLLPNFKDIKREV